MSCKPCGHDGEGVEWVATRLGGISIISITEPIDVTGGRWGRGALGERASQANLMSRGGRWGRGALGEGASTAIFHEQGIERGWASDGWR